MTSHYFTDNKVPEKATERRFNLHFRSVTLSFVTNEGMFSHGEADPNSVLLMRSVSLPHMQHMTHMPTVPGTPRLLDLGCGYGLIGITLSKAYGFDLTMSDVNSNALFYAEKNAAANGVHARIIKSDGFENIADDYYDYITLNPPIHAGKDVCFRLYEGASKHLTKTGQFIAVFMDKHGGATHRKKLCELFATVKDVYNSGGVKVVVCMN